MLFFFFIISPLIMATKADFNVSYLNVCPTSPEVVSGTVINKNVHPVKNIFSGDRKDWLFNLNSIASDYGQFIIDRGCSSAVNGVMIINTENDRRSSKKVRVLVSNSLLDNSWIEVVLQGDLPDTTNCLLRDDCLSMSELYYSFSTRFVRYVKLQVLEIHPTTKHGSVGGGLMKFDILFDIIVEGIW